MTCKARREGDEYVCPTCHLRWDYLEAGPPCPKAVPTEAIEVRLAKAIIQPRLDRWVLRDKAKLSRAEKWQMFASPRDREDATTSAVAVLKELKAMPREELLRALDQGNWE